MTKLIHEINTFKNTVKVYDDKVIVSSRTFAGKIKEKEIFFNEVTRMYKDYMSDSFKLFKGAFSSVQIKDLEEVLKKIPDIDEFIEEKTELKFQTIGNKGKSYKDKYLKEDTGEEGNIVKCPKCGSTNFMAGNQKFSGKRMLVGSLLAGPLGAAVGATTSKKVVITCLNCGHKWNPGKN